MQKSAEQEKIRQEQNEKGKIEYDKKTEAEKAVQKETGKEAEYKNCLGAAYKEYKQKYDKECGKFIMDGECVVSQEKRSELDGYYMYEKKQCEKLRQ